MHILRQCACRLLPGSISAPCHQNPVAACDRGFQTFIDCRCAALERDPGDRHLASGAAHAQALWRQGDQGKRRPSRRACGRRRNRTVLVECARGSLCRWYSIRPTRYRKLSAGKRQVTVQPNPSYNVALPHIQGSLSASLDQIDAILKHPARLCRPGRQGTPQSRAESRVSRPSKAAAGERRTLRWRKWDSNSPSPQDSDGFETAVFAVGEPTLLPKGTGGLTPLSATSTARAQPLLGALC